MKDKIQIISSLRSRLLEDRFFHSLNVADTAKELALLYGANPEQAYLAGLVHDCTKNTPPQVQLQMMEQGGMFICADNGVGFVTADGTYEKINTNDFNNSIDNMLIDYQGNLWFTSSRLGLLRMAQSDFRDIYTTAGMEKQVANTVVRWNDTWYFGTDKGMDAVDLKGQHRIRDAVTDRFEIKTIARLYSDLPDKFGLPRQAGIVEALEGRIVFEPGFRNPDALRGIEGFSHLWLIWRFSETVREDWSPTVRPPRLGGNTRVGVFATRSPFRPNALGLSCVRLLGVETDPALGPVLRVGGADLMSGTPIVDIKPYLPYADCRPEAGGGFAPDPGETRPVVFAPGEEEKIPAEKRAALRGVLAQDPRPRYQKDPERLYGLRFAGRNVKFRVEEERVYVAEVQE